MRILIALAAVAVIAAGCQTTDGALERARAVDDELIEFDIEVGALVDKALEQEAAGEIDDAIDTYRAATELCRKANDRCRVELQNLAEAHMRALQGGGWIARLLRGVGKVVRDIIMIGIGIITGISITGIIRVIRGVLLK